MFVDSCQILCINKKLYIQVLKQLYHFHLNFMHLSCFLPNMELLFFDEKTSDEKNYSSFKENTIGFWF